MQHRGETALIDAIVDARERDAVEIAARMLRTGATMGIVEGMCSEAMHAMGKAFMPCAECIDEVAAVDHIVDRIVNLETFARFETELALAPAGEWL